MSKKKKEKTEMKKAEKDYVYVCDVCGCHVMRTTPGRSPLVCGDHVIYSC